MTIQHKLGLGLLTAAVHAGKVTLPLLPGYHRNYAVNHISNSEDDCETKSFGAKSDNFQFFKEKQCMTTLKIYNNCLAPQKI